MASLYSLVADTGERFDYVLANPPFGKKSSMTFTNEVGEQQKDVLLPLFSKRGHYRFELTHRRLRLCLSGLLY